MASIGSFNVTMTSTTGHSDSPLLTSVTCNLCGGESAVVSCCDCDSLHFCSSCDDMYHRHPKRKFHLRKSVASNIAQVSSVNKRHDIGHPSNMPIPPPRRKKSFNNLTSQVSNGSLDDLNNMRNQVNWRPTVNANTTYVQGLSSSSADVYMNEAMTSRPSAPSHPPQHMASPSVYNSTCQWPPITRSYNAPPVMYASASELSGPSSVPSESIILPNDASNIPTESITSDSVNNLQGKVSTNILRKRSNSLTRHRNNSLQDLRRQDDRYATMAPYSYMSPPSTSSHHMPPPGHAYYGVYGNPYAYWGNYGAPPNELDMNDDLTSSDSVDDDQEDPVNDGDERRGQQQLNQQEDQRRRRRRRRRRSASQSRRSSSRDQRSSSRSRMVNNMYPTLGPRSVSTFQLPPPPPMWSGYPGAPYGMMPPPPPPPPPPHAFYAYPGAYSSYYGSYVHSLASSPPGSIRSSSMARKRSLDNFSTASSLRASDTGHRSSANHASGNHGQSNSRRSLDRINYQRVTNSRNSRHVNGQGRSDSIRSVVSSRFGDTDSDDLLDVDDFYSASDDAIDVKHNGRQNVSTEKVHHHQQQQQQQQSEARSSDVMRSNKSGRRNNSIKDTAGCSSKFNGHRASSHRGKSRNGQVYNEDESDDNDYHHHADNSINDTSINDESAPSDKWSCKHCTFINASSNAICAVCSKSNVKLTQEEQGSEVRSRKSSKILSVVQEIEEKVKQDATHRQPKKLQSQLSSSRKKYNDTAECSGEGAIEQVNLTDDLIVNDELVREQIEIENELRRRRENEKRIERQNKRIEDERHRQQKQQQWTQSEMEGEEVRGENKNWRESKLDDEAEKKIATGKVNKRNDDRSKRKDGKSIDGHVDDIYIEEDDVCDEVDDASEDDEEVSSINDNMGHSTIAPSVSPAEWKRLASKKKPIKKRRSDSKVTENSCLRSSGDYKSESTREQRSGEKESAEKKEGKKSFSVQVRVNESKENDLESLISSLATTRLNSSQLEKVIKSVSENVSKDDSMSASSSSSSSTGESGSATHNVLKRVLLEKLLEEQLMNERIRVNALARLTQKTANESIFECPTSAYAINMIQPASTASVMSMNASPFTPSNALPGNLSNVPHAMWRQQFTPSQQLFGDASSTLMLMTSQMRGQGEPSIQSSGNSYYTHFTGINPYGGMVDTISPSTSSPSSHPPPPPPPPFAAPRASPALSPGAMSTSISSTCNPVTDNGYSVAQNIAESTSEQQGYQLNSKSSNSTSTDHGDHFYSTKTCLPSSSSSASSSSAARPSTTAAIEMIKILKEAKKQGFTVDEVEIALNTHSNEPIEWLRENWSQMVQSVLTLTNNSIILMSQNASSTFSNNNLIELNDARNYLRKSHGDIYLAVENALASYKHSHEASVNNKFTDTDSRQCNNVSKLHQQVVKSGGDSVDDDEDEDNFYSPDEDAIDCLITKWKNERLNCTDSEICQLFQMSPSDKEKRLKNETDVNVKESVVPRKGDIDSLRNYLIKKYFGSEDALNAATGVDEGELAPATSAVDAKNITSKGDEATKCDTSASSVKSANAADDHSSPMNTNEDDEGKCGDIEDKLQEKKDKSAETLTQSNSGDNGGEVVDQSESVSRRDASQSENMNAISSDKSGESEQFNRDIESEYEEEEEEEEEEEKEVVDDDVDSDLHAAVSTLDCISLCGSINGGDVAFTASVVDALDDFERQYSKNVPLDEQSVILYECELCAVDYPIDKMVSMLACEHRACETCIKTYLTIQIREFQTIIIQCPFCTEPSYDPVNDDDEIFTYLSLMDELIKNLLDSDTHNLFQRKLRDRSLMKDPSFRWCISCSSGFVSSSAVTPVNSTVKCPDCGAVMCVNCNEKWLPQHENVTCEVFSDWKKANDPVYAARQLNNHLNQFGIDCPSCKFHYELAKGGCMHFHCIQCGYDFCGGCYKRFVTGSECSISSYCDKMGLHAHHPRNCLFYLRDKEPDVLKRLLDESKVDYAIKLPASLDGKSKSCPIMEQKRSSIGYKDEICGRSIEFTGLCRLHYIEYLGQLIFNHKIDPINIFEVYELELVLRRNNVQVTNSLDKSSPDYREILVKLIKEQCPLDSLA